MEFNQLGLKKEWILKNELGEETINELKIKNVYVKDIFIVHLPHNYTLSVDFLPKKTGTFHGFLSKLSRGDGLNYKSIYHIQGAWSTLKDSSTSGLFVRIKDYLSDYVNKKGIEKFNQNAYKKYLQYKNKLYTYKENYFICLDKKNQKEIFRKQIGLKPIERIELSPIENGIIIWSKDAHPVVKGRTRSLGLYDEFGENIWYAEKEDKGVYNEGYTSLKFIQHKLFAHFAYDVYCEIDLKTGNILSRRFTK